MKVLYISAAAGADYLDNMVMHGMRSVLGADCVDVNKQSFMYQGANPPFHTVYANLPDIPVDRENISEKIRSHYFDAIVYGSIHRSQEYLTDVLLAYPKNQIAMIDGEDDHGIAAVAASGTYFKRELNDEPFFPITFCVPKEKIIDALPPKTRLFAHCDPRDRATYIYYGDNGEANYYYQYGESYFGYTMKKGGWDCCRHYEILAAGAIPYFAGIETCPPQTLFTWPRAELLYAREMADHWGDHQLLPYEGLLFHLRTLLRERMTTEAIARYVLEKIA